MNILLLRTLLNHHLEIKKDILEQGAILQRDKKTYAVAPHIPGGIITDSNILRKMADVLDKYNAAAIKVTSSQRLALIGIQEDDLDAVWNELGMEKGCPIGSCVRSVRICPAQTFCKRAQQDTVSLGLEIDKMYHGMDLPAKFKIAVSGCPNSCSENAARDLGVMGNNKGYTIVIGGSAGVLPRIADKLTENITREEVVPLVEKVIKYYKENARKYERFGRMIERIGIEKVKDDLLG